MPKFLALIVAVILIFGGYYYLKGEWPKWLNLPQMEEATKVEETAKTENIQEATMENVPVNSFEECLAAGNLPLPDAPDKCLTKDGHIFIEGVIEN